MIKTIDQLTKQALKLPLQDRERLVSSIMESTHSKDITSNDSLWLSIAEERYADLISGSDPGISEGDFFLKVEERL